MAVIGPIGININKGPSAWVVRVSYTLTGTEDEVDYQASYHERVQLVGDDNRPGEDGLDDILPGGLLVDGLAVFTSTTPIPRSFAVAIPGSVLREDPSARGLPVHEIKARVTLTPVGAASERTSGLVHLGGRYPPQP